MERRKERNKEKETKKRTFQEEEEEKEEEEEEETREREEWVEAAMKIKGRKVVAGVWFPREPAKKREGKLNRQSWPVSALKKQPNKRTNGKDEDEERRCVKIPYCQSVVNRLGERTWCRVLSASSLDSLSQEPLSISSLHTTYHSFFIIYGW